MGTIELQIGEIRDDVKCVESPGPEVCKTCYYYPRTGDNSTRCLDMVCQGKYRKDGKDVHFIKVK